MDGKIIIQMGRGAFSLQMVPLSDTIVFMTKLEKIIKQIIDNPKSVKARDFEKYLLHLGFEMRDGDEKKTHRHYFHPSDPALLIVIVFSKGDETILNRSYIQRYLKEIAVMLKDKNNEEKI
ncbi:MAG: hypothetical protein HQK52_19385 [Oligoflexia bacterium]|nr:hypothetical protein [Oligoflexia bacterium]